MEKTFITIICRAYLTTITMFVRQYIYSDFDYLAYLTVAMCIDSFLAVVLNFSHHNLSFSLFTSKTTRKIFKYSVLLILGNLASHYTVNSEEVRYINWFHDFICTYLIVVEILSSIRTLNTLFPSFVPSWVIERLKDVEKGTKNSIPFFVCFLLLSSCSSVRQTKEYERCLITHDTVYSTRIERDLVTVREDNTTDYRIGKMYDTVLQGNTVYIYRTDTVIKNSTYHFANVSKMGDTTKSIRVSDIAERQNIHEKTLKNGVVSVHENVKKYVPFFLIVLGVVFFLIRYKKRQ